MAITPISGAVSNKNSFINFNGRGSDAFDYVEDGRSYRGPVSGLKKVPVIVLLAMSPLSTPATEPYSPIANEPKIVMVDGVQQDYARKIHYTTKLYSGNEYCRFFQFDTDHNTSNAEALSFNYGYETGKGYDGIMDGRFRIMAREDEEDGSRIVVYTEFDKDGVESAPKICKIPARFVQYISRFAESGYNNKAVGIYSKAAIAKKFGTDAVNNAAPIKEHISRILYADGSEKSISSISNFK